MSETMEGIIETSNNVGQIVTEEEALLVTSLTRSIIDTDMKELADEIKEVFAACGGISKTIVESHSTSERVEQKTIDDIWQVLLELLWRMS